MVADPQQRNTKPAEQMNRKLYSLALIALAILVISTGCASVTASSGSQASVRKSSRERILDRTRMDLPEREKWSLAREAYSQALHEQERNDNDAASEFFEATLELLGSLDLASIELPTQRVLEFQRKVLASYDKFLASVETLPATAGTAIVLESTPAPEIGDTDVPITESAIPSKSGAAPRPEISPLHPDPLPPVPLVSNRQVGGQLSFFMNKGRKVMERWMERAAVVFPRLRPILREEGVPEEVMYLAMIESGLNLRAYSYAHAAGVWQFIPGTGRIYGLRIESTYDERLNVESATRAACRYLRKLHDEFGDWYLAFAAYNCGEGRVAKEIRRSNTTDYWRLTKLPRQTRNYVPTYLAARTICENPTNYGFSPRPPEVPFECQRIFIDDAYHLDHIARAAGVDPFELRDLNPEFRRNVTPGHANVLVRLPKHAHSDWEMRLAAMPKTEIEPTTVHRVRKGETLKKIAARYGVSTGEISRHPDNKRVSWKKLKVGQDVVIPVPTATASVAEAQENSGGSGLIPTAVAAEKEAHEIVYTVHRGETLGRIAGQVGVSVDEICRQNNIKNPNQIEPGQKLRIKITDQVPQVAEKKPAPAKSNAQASKQLHRVRTGDTLWAIARAYGVNTESIMRWNGLKKSSRIYPGQKLVVGWQ